MAELNFNNYKCTLVLEDEYTINDTYKLKDIFIEILTKAEQLELKIDGEFKFDAAFLQLFYSAVKAFCELGIKTSIFVKNSDAFLSSFKEYGFNNLNSVEIIQKS